MYVIGTAGHVDHGKSTLVKALTGIDPDRLPEEKSREMTIDLGFAWLKLPSGREVSIVDVPGHERFIKNMLAGVGGIDLALLVIAADEGVMPQTREHLSILDLLQVRNGVAAITKMDLVDGEWLGMIAEEVKEILRPTSLSDAPVVAVSSVSGDGLAALVDVLDEVLEKIKPRRETGKPRLPIDRVFTVAGFGTVVTGTLSDGRLTLGQEVEVVPRGIRSRVRGLQTHKRKVDQVLPGTRVAVNLSGVATEDVERGDVLTTPGWLNPTSVVDARLKLTKDIPKPLAHNVRVSFHTGSSEAIGRVRLLDREELAPGAEGWCQVKLERPLAVTKGDFFIIRSTQTTLGGGHVVEPYPKRHKRFHQATLESLATLDKGGPEEILLQKLAEKEPASIKELVEGSGLPAGEGRKTLQALIDKGELVSLTGKNDYVMTGKGWEGLRGEVRRVMEGYHGQFPLRSGMPKEELKSRLRLDPRFFTPLIQHLSSNGEVLEARGLLRLPDHRAALTPFQQSVVDAFLRTLASDPYSPPTDNMPDADLVSFLVDHGKVIKVGEVLFEPGIYREMIDRIKAHIKNRGRITVAEVRDMFNSSRKYALALLEHLDEQKITRRVGDERILTEGASR